MKLVLKVIWNALPLVAIALAVWLFINSKGCADSEGEGPVRANPPVLEAIKHVNKQIFIEHYSMVDVQYKEAPAGWEWLENLGIKQEFIVLVRGRIPAGFDLQQVNESNIWISQDGKRVQLTLPPPVIFEDNVALDFENSRILSQSDTCPDFVCKNNLEAYQADVLPTARDLLIDFARQSGILDQAAMDGKLYYEQLLKSLGFEEVIVIVTGYGL